MEGMRRQQYWLANDPVLTHFFNALQATFPEGERFFIDSARDVRVKLGEHVKAGLVPEHGEPHAERRIENAAYRRFSLILLGMFRVLREIGVFLKDTWVGTAAAMSENARHSDLVDPV